MTKNVNYYLFIVNNYYLIISIKNSRKTLISLENP